MKDSSQAEIGKCEVLIIGTGIIARVMARRLAELNVSFLFLGTQNKIDYKIISGNHQTFVTSDFKGEIDNWGNAHDFDFKTFWNPSSFASLPGFPFDAEELESVKDIFHNYLGIPRRISVANRATQQLQGLEIHRHFRSPKRNFSKKFPLDISKVLFGSEESIKITLGNSGDIGVEFQNEDKDKFVISPNYLVFACGGLGNLVRCHNIFCGDGNKTPINIGTGYTNHPKYLTHKVELSRYTRTSTFAGAKKLKKQWELFQVYDLDSRGAGLRFPRVSSRLWVSADSRNPQSKWPNFRGVLEVFLRKVGLSKTFSVMTYFEVPQEINSRLILECQSKGIIKLKHVSSLSEEHKSFYRNSLKRQAELLSSLKNVTKVESYPDKIADLESIDSHHYMGTTRMSENPEFGISNKWGEIHNLNNVFCVGTSVLPVSAVNHPTYLSSLLTLRTANCIAERVHGKKVS